MDKKKEKGKKRKARWDETVTKERTNEWKKLLKLSQFQTIYFEYTYKRLSSFRTTIIKQISWKYIFKFWEEPKVSSVCNSESVISI